MNTDEAVRAGRPSNHSRTLPWWSMVVRAFLAGIFLEAVFAGAMLSGIEWARRAHVATATVLVTSTFVAGVAAFIKLRRIPQGLKFALTLLALAAALTLQAVLGTLTAKGAILLWLHVPLGVAMFGIASQVVAAARSLQP